MRHFAVQMRIVLVVRFAVLAVSFAAIPRHQSNRPFDFLVPVHMHRTKKNRFQVHKHTKKMTQFSILTSEVIPRVPFSLIVGSALQFIYCRRRDCDAPSKQHDYQLPNSSSLLFRADKKNPFNFAV